MISIHRFYEDVFCILYDYWFDQWGVPHVHYHDKSSTLSPPSFKDNDYLQFKCSVSQKPVSTVCERCSDLEDNHTSAISYKMPFVLRFLVLNASHSDCFKWSRKARFFPILWLSHTFSLFRLFNIKIFASRVWLHQSLQPFEAQQPGNTTKENEVTNPLFFCRWY